MSTIKTTEHIPLKIIKMGHPTLSKPANSVKDPTDQKIKKIVNDMIATANAANGAAGLAAPQVNIPLRIFIFRENTNESFTTVINPKIEYIGNDIVRAYEACLSLPDVAGEVPRYKKINYTYQTLDGKTVTKEAVDFHAKVVQHEADHLDGILYVQRMDDMSKFGYLDEITERIKKNQESKH